MKLKTIRFNLRFHMGPDEAVSVRTLEELASSFNLDELMDYYRSGQLERWLSCHDETEKAVAVGKIDRDSPEKEQIVKLFKALELEVDKGVLLAAIASYLYPGEMVRQRLERAQAMGKLDELVGKEFAAYEKALHDIVAVREDFAEVGQRVRAVLKHYGCFFRLDFIRFYEIMAKECPLAIFAVLSLPAWRHYFCQEPIGSSCPIPPEQKLESIYGRSAFSFDEASAPIEYFRRRLSQLVAVKVSSSTFELRIDNRTVTEDDYLLSKGIVRQVAEYSRGQSMWQDEVGKGRKVMVLWNSGVEVRANADRENQYSADSLNGKFVVLDGLDYRVSGSLNSACLLYLEV